MKYVMKAETIEKGIILYYPDKAIKTKLIDLLKSVKEKYNGYLTVDIQKPYKSRTTGKGSQNNLFWKLVQLISEENGEDIKETEHDLKIKAISKGYPYHLSKLTGQPIPESTTKINTVEMSYLIETAYEVCAFLGIVTENEMQMQIEENKKIVDEPKFDIY